MKNERLIDLYQLFYEEETCEQTKRLLKEEICEVEELSEESKKRILHVMKTLMTEQMKFLVSLEKRKQEYKENERRFMFM